MRRSLCENPEQTNAFSKTFELLQKLDKALRDGVNKAMNRRIELDLKGVEG